VKVSTLLVAVGASLLAPAALAPPVHAIDLTGTWAGKWRCQGFDGDKFTSTNNESTLLITQVGNVISASIDGGEFLYNGGAIDETAHPITKGEAALVQCGTDNLPFAGEEAEIVRASAKVNPDNGSGKLKGISALESAFPDVLICKYSYKRTDTADPAVPLCP
jgi:hypothetical protein